MDFWCHTLHPTHTYCVSIEFLFFFLVFGQIPLGIYIQYYYRPVHSEYYRKQSTCNRIWSTLGPSKEQNGKEKKVEKTKLTFVHWFNAFIKYSFSCKFITCIANIRFCRSFLFSPSLSHSIFAHQLRFRLKRLIHNRGDRFLFCSFCNDLRNFFFAFFNYLSAFIWKIYDFFTCLDGGFMDFPCENPSFSTCTIVFIHCSSLSGSRVLFFFLFSIWVSVFFSSL